MLWIADGLPHHARFKLLRNFFNGCLARVVDDFVNALDIVNLRQPDSRQVPVSSWRSSSSLISTGDCADVGWGMMWSDVPSSKSKRAGYFGVRVNQFESSCGRSTPVSKFQVGPLSESHQEYPPSFVADK